MPDASSRKAHTRACLLRAAFTPASHAFSSRPARRRFRAKELRRNRRSIARAEFLCGGPRLRLVWPPFHQQKRQTRGFGNADSCFNEAFALVETASAEIVRIDLQPHPAGGQPFGGVEQSPGRSVALAGWRDAELIEVAGFGVDRHKTGRRA